MDTDVLRLDLAVDRERAVQILALDHIEEVVARRITEAARAEPALVVALGPPEDRRSISEAREALEGMSGPLGQRARGVPSRNLRWFAQLLLAEVEVEEDSR